MDYFLVKLTVTALALAAVFQACSSAPLIDTSGPSKNDIEDYSKKALDVKRASTRRKQEHSTSQGWGPGGMPYGALYYRNRSFSSTKMQQASSLETNSKEPVKVQQQQQPANHKLKLPSYRRRPSRLPHTVIPHQFIVSYGWRQN